MRHTAPFFAASDFLQASFNFLDDAFYKLVEPFICKSVIYGNRTKTYNFVLQVHESYTAPIYCAPIWTCYWACTLIEINYLITLI